ncbi:hypothetical protein EGW08_005436 [Elysia chlorotica]|uniref:Uncharacterized protein n=1 Tax=Elysia chlorotica TaxID=188477 RepID=A0A433TYW7_ELYCH|nr:hypothetical protein EGW08_005436 [Elysia chlorotica]
MRIRRPTTSRKLAHRCTYGPRYQILCDHGLAWTEVNSVTGRQKAQASHWFFVCLFVVFALRPIVANTGWDREGPSFTDFKVELRQPCERGYPRWQAFVFYQFNPRKGKRGSLWVTVDHCGVPDAWKRRLSEQRRSYLFIDPRLFGDSVGLFGDSRSEVSGCSETVGVKCQAVRRQSELSVRLFGDSRSEVSGCSETVGVKCQAVRRQSE